MEDDCEYRRICELYIPEHCDFGAKTYCGLFRRREEARITELEASLNCECVGACDESVLKRLGV